MELKEINYKLGIVQGGIVESSTVDVLRQKITMRIRVVEENEHVHDLEILGIATFYGVHRPGFASHQEYPGDDEDVLPYVELTDIFLLDQWTEIELTPADYASSGANVYLAMWFQEYFIECDKIVLDGEVFDVRQFYKQ